MKVVCQPENPAFRRGFLWFLERNRVGSDYATIFVTTPDPESVCGTPQRRFRGCRESEAERYAVEGVLRTKPRLRGALHLVQE